MAEQNIIQFLPDATFIIDIEGKVIFWNKAMEELTNVKAKEILGKNVKNIFSSADATVNEQVISKGASAFINKPFDIQELKKLIKNVMNEVII